MRSRMPSRGSEGPRPDEARPRRRSRTTSDRDILRRRDSASICATSASGNRTVRVFMWPAYYASAKGAIHGLQIVESHGAPPIRPPEGGVDGLAVGPDPVGDGLAGGLG